MSRSGGTPGLHVATRMLRTDVTREQTGKTCVQDAYQYNSQVPKVGIAIVTLDGVLVILVKHGCETAHLLVIWSLAGSKARRAQHSPDARCRIPLMQAVPEQWKQHRCDPLLPTFCGTLHQVNDSCPAGACWQLPSHATGASWLYA